MKILGDAGDKTYLVQISHYEIEKVVGKYYGNLKALKVGDEVDIAAGYDFANDIKDETIRGLKAKVAELEKDKSLLVQLSYAARHEIEDLEADRRAMMVRWGYADGDKDRLKEKIALLETELRRWRPIRQDHGGF